MLCINYDYHRCGSTKNRLQGKDSSVQNGSERFRLEGCVVTYLQCRTVLNGSALKRVKFKPGTVQNGSERFRTEA